MQCLLGEITTTFVRDAVAFVNGFGRIVTVLATAPLERIARACDVSGILAERAARAAERERTGRAWRSLRQRTPNPYRSRRHSGWFGCLRSLGELT